MISLRSVPPAVSLCTPETDLCKKATVSIMSRLQLRSSGLHTQTVEIRANRTAEWWFKVAPRIRHYIGVSQFSLDVMRPISRRGTCQRRPKSSKLLWIGARLPRENEAFVFLGRFSPEKGAQVFAEAASRANVPAIFVGAGELASDLRRSVLRAISRLATADSYRHDKASASSGVSLTLARDCGALRD